MADVSVDKLMEHSQELVAYQFSKVVKSGKTEEAVIGGLALAAVWVGAKGIDIARNAMAKQKARDQLLGYYQQLTVKQDLIIKKQMQVAEELKKQSRENDEKTAELKQQYDMLTAQLKKILLFKDTVKA